MYDNPYQPPGPGQMSPTPNPPQQGSDAMMLKRVGVLSVGKMLGCLYALLGLLVGGIMSLLALGGAAWEGLDRAGPALLVNIGAIVFLPIVYGALGFVGGIIMAAFYNAVASLVGGIEMEFRRRS
jgi:hypothetical protein